MFTDPRERAGCVAVFERHNREVQEFVPVDRLLVLRVQDGWEPLCAFLEREVPTGTPFPHLKEGKETLEALARERFFGRWLRASRVALAGGVAFLLWLLLR